MTMRVLTTTVITLQGDWSDRVEYVRNINNIPANADLMSIDVSVKYNATNIIFKYATTVNY